MAKPPTGVVGCGQPVGVTATPRYDCLQHDTRRDGRLQGAPARGGRQRLACKGRLLVARATVSKGNRRLRRGDGGNDIVVRVREEG
ncbi:hypothetical protein B296_00026262 [Ensete ventricosum]|uniref:Uncharacterized protein n=1 Tax=Ensete ventricosum TaxID=4639 RepID=A0A426XBR1_ENSVE|nr:hypothetical protein B296_00026262 [Ensete ventricosum]